MTLPSFEGEHLEWVWTSWLSLQGQAPKFPHGRLKISGSSNWVEHRW